MAEGPNLEFLGRQIERLLEGQHAIVGRLDRIEERMATREQLTRLWRVVEGKVELARDEHLDAIGRVDGRVGERLSALEARVRRLEEPEPA